VDRFAGTQALAALAAPTPKDEVKTRPGRGGSGALSYIDARFVFDRFDAAIGPDLWQLEVGFSPALHTPEQTNRKGEVIVPEWLSAYPVARIGVLCENGWVWKSDIGVFSDIEGVKGSVSDSIKRAAVQWGVGRDLYDPDSEARGGKAASEPAGERQSTDTGVEKVPDGWTARTGLTDAQRGKLFAALAKAGMTGDRRKAFVFLSIGKHSVKDMTNADLDAVLDILDSPRDARPDVWENALLVSPD
jgi:hypothetical protein